ncbi:uncharacterized [Tachysurus ichikawai]
MQLMQKGESKTLAQPPTRTLDDLLLLPTRTAIGCCLNRLGMRSRVSGDIGETGNRKNQQEGCGIGGPFTVQTEDDGRTAAR